MRVNLAAVVVPIDAELAAMGSPIRAALPDCKPTPERHGPSDVPTGPRGSRVFDPVT